MGEDLGSQGENEGDGLDQIREELNKLDQKFHEDDRKMELEQKAMEMGLDEQSVLSTFDGKVQNRDLDISKSHQYKIMYTSSRDKLAPERDADSYKSYHSESENSDEAQDIILQVNKYQKSKIAGDDNEDIELGQDSINDSQSKKSSK